MAAGAGWWSLCTAGQFHLLTDMQLPKRILSFFERITV